MQDVFVKNTRHNYKAVENRYLNDLDYISRSNIIALCIFL